ncbi:hypothetical protein DL89DRAFT_175523 [Linderina pennispora]|uniref:Uncharacterized protein n=1 Tax=Linderina pennispora TaxID=61395 RepID=A0A1Y1VU95_9FUNG|nr:uncharacterized protein DL89DRAFT_175523 [Linderina pennispora]ORX64575.1 hypothetical protein DL89DRAFT_175523 [Linderina pennispora]
MTKDLATCMAGTQKCMIWILRVRRRYTCSRPVIAHYVSAESTGAVPIDLLALGPGRKSLKMPVHVFMESGTHMLLCTTPVWSRQGLVSATAPMGTEQLPLLNDTHACTGKHSDAAAFAFLLWDLLCKSAREERENTRSSPPCRRLSRMRAASGPSPRQFCAGSNQERLQSGGGAPAIFAVHGLPAIPPPFSLLSRNESSPL